MQPPRRRPALEQYEDRNPASDLLRSLAFTEPSSPPPLNSTSEQYAELPPGLRDIVWNEDILAHQDTTFLDLRIGDNLEGGGTASVPETHDEPPQGLFASNVAMTSDDLFSDPVEAPFAPQEAPQGGGAGGGVDGLAGSMGAGTASFGAQATDTNSFAPQSGSSPTSGNGSGDAGLFGAASADQAQSAAATSTPTPHVTTAALAAPSPAAPSPAALNVTTHPVPNRAALLDAFAALPLAFERNAGQTSGAVDFLARSPGYTAFLSKEGVTLGLLRPTRSADGSLQTGTNAALTVKLAGANPQATVEGVGLLDSRANYFNGNDPTQWHGDVEQFGRVVYHDVYTGIDLAYYGTREGKVEFDFIVKPGADARQIQLDVSGAQSVHLNAAGDLVLATAGGDVIQHAPVLYQMQGDTKQLVSGRFELGANGKVGIVAGPHDASRELCVDPVLDFSGYLGGSGDDTGIGVAVDALGNSYWTGNTASSNFPGTASGTYAGNGDVFVTRLNSTGTAIVYSTYVGGSGLDQVGGMALYPGGYVVVAGTTASSNFPTSTTAYQRTLKGSTDPFAFILNATGDALVWSSLAGGTSTSEQVNGVALTPDGHIVIVGQTDATDFPTTSGAYQTTNAGGTDAFALEFKIDGTGREWASYLGGSSTDIAYGVVADNTGVYIGGSTPGGSTSFPTTSGAWQTTAGGGTTDGFVAKLNASGTGLSYSTRAGGSAADEVRALALWYTNVLFTGQTYSSNYATTSGAPDTTLTGTGTSDAILTELNSSGTGVVYSSLYGGDGNERGQAVVVDTAGAAWFTGWTTSSNLPTASPTQSTYGGSQDAFLAAISAAGTTLFFGTYLGGTGTDEGRGLAIDANGSLYVAGSTTGGFPTQHAFQASSGGGSDAFMVRFNPSTGGTSFDATVPTFIGISSDTGTSSSDQITTDQTLMLGGTAPASSTVSLYRAGVGLIATITASTSGVWGFDYSGTTLPEGVAAFSATATVGGVTSDRSKDFDVHVDLTAPALTLTAPSSTYSRDPQVTVTASDLNGMPDGTTVTFDVDLNNNGNFTDAGETGFASTTLLNGFATIQLGLLAAGTTVRVRARASDRAGNQGTSNVATIAINSVGSAAYTTTGTVRVPDPLDGDPLLQSGRLQITHPLDLDKSPGAQQSGNLALVYDSGTAGATAPIVQATIQMDNSGSMPSSIAAQLTWDGSLNSGGSWSFSGSANGDPITLAVPVMGGVTGVGRHTWSLTLTITTSGGTVTRTITGQTFVVNLSSSPYGAGWNVGGVDRLYSIASSGSYPAGLLRVYGSGGYRFWADAGSGNYTAPQGDNGTLVAVTGGWTYTTPEGDVTAFNSAGMQTGWTSADGNSTLSWTYTDAEGDGHADELSTMTAIDGATTAFNYTSGKLSSVVTAGPRTWTIAQSSGNVTRITNPDGGQRNFTYDTSHRLTGESFAGLTNTWTYSSTGTVQSLQAGSGGTTYLSPAVLAGLSSAAIGVASATVTDPLSHVTVTKMDDQGRPIAVRDAAGGLSTWTRDSNGRVSSQTDAMGRTTSFTRDSLGYVTLETLPDGKTQQWSYQTAFHALTQYTDERLNSWGYTYDSQGHKLTETDPLSETTTYGWTSGLLTTVTDANSHVVDTLSYDTSRRLTQDTDYYSNYEGLTYDADGNVATDRDKNGNTTTFVNDAMGRPTQETAAISGIVTNWVYTGAGLVTDTTDANGGVDHEVYNDRGLVTQSWQGYGSTTPVMELMNYDSAGEQTSQRDAAGWTSSETFDALFRVVQTTSARGATAKTFYNLDGEVIGSEDADGHYSSEVINSRGEVTSSTDAAGNTTVNTFDDNGNLLTSTDAASHVWTNQYDALNRDIKVTNPLGKYTQTSFDNLGNVLTTTDELGNVTRNSYDVLNRVLSTTDAYGTSNAVTRSETYDANGNVLTETDGQGKVTSLSYDALNRELSTTDPLSHTTSQTLDKVGNVLTSTDALSKVTTFVYNSLNEVATTTDPLSHVVQTSWDPRGFQTRTIDGTGNASSESYDEDGNLRTEVDARGGVTWRGFDAANNLQRLVDPVGNVWTWEFDGDNREVKRTDPLNHSVTTTYNTAGLIDTIADRLGRKKIYTYDADNRVSSEVQKDASNTTVDTLSYTYNDAGDVLTASNNAGTETLTYDELRRLKTQTDTFGFVLTLGYNHEYRTSVADSSGATIASTYNDAGLLSSRTYTDGTTNLRIDQGFNAADERTSQSRYSDLTGTTLVGTTIEGYDDAGNLTGLQYKNASGTNLSNYVNAFDADNRIASETLNGGTPTNYTYDVTSQLTVAGSENFGYDANGNRDTTGYTVGAGNRVTSDGTWTYTYDNEGNMIKRSKGASAETWTYGYDNNNQELWAEQRATDGGTLLYRVDYVYDSFSQRVEETVATGGTTTITKFVNLDQQIYAELSSTNAVQTRYLRGDATSEVFARVSSGGANWLLQDRIGSLRDVTDSSGAGIDHIDYAAFGAIMSESNSAQTGRFGFQGLPYNRTEQESHACYRDLLFSTGMWKQEDPDGFRANDPNLHRAMGNNSTNLTDASGLDPYGPIFMAMARAEREKRQKETMMSADKKWKANEYFELVFGRYTEPKKSFFDFDPALTVEALIYARACIGLAELRIGDSIYSPKFEFFTDLGDATRRAHVLGSGAFIGAIQSNAEKFIVKQTATRLYPSQIAQPVKDNDGNHATWHQLTEVTGYWEFSGPKEWSSSSSSEFWKEGQDRFVTHSPTLPKYEKTVYVVGTVSGKYPPLQQSPPNPGSSGQLKFRTLRN